MRKLRIMYIYGPETVIKPEFDWYWSGRIICRALKRGGLSCRPRQAEQAVRPSLISRCSYNEKEKYLAEKSK